MPCGAPKRATRWVSAALTATATRWRSGAGKNLIFLGGGIAMPPIRCAIWYALENRADYGQITIVYGARTVRDLVFVDELADWAAIPGVRVIRCVDRAARPPTGMARSASSRRSSSAPPSQPATRWRW